MTRHGGGPRGLFVGLTTMDVLHRASRRPGLDEKVTASRQDVAAGGPAANAAVTFAALGGRARLLTALGATGAAVVARDDLERHAIAILDAATADHPLAVSAVLVDDATGQRSVVSADAALAAVPPPQTVDLDGLDVVLLDGHHPDLARAVLAALPAEAAAEPAARAGAGETAVREEPGAGSRPPGNVTPGEGSAGGGAAADGSVGDAKAGDGSAGDGSTGVAAAADGSVGDAAPQGDASPIVVLDCGRWRPVFAELLPAAHVAALSADFRMPGVTDAGAETARAVLDAGAHAVVITDGAGPVRWWADRASGTIAVEQVPVRDTLGAGDAFHGALAAALAGGAELPAAVARAAQVATRRVTSVGPRAWLTRLDPWWSRSRSR